MSLLLIEGFDLYNGVGTGTGFQAKWTVTNSTPNSMQTGRFSSGQAVRFNAGGVDCAAFRGFSANASITLGAAMRISAVPSGTPAHKAHLAVKTGTTFQCGIGFGAGGIISAYRFASESSGTLLGSSAAGVIVANVWNYIEVEIVLSTTVGRITVYVNGTQVLNLTGQNTANAGAGTTADTLYIGSTNGGNAPGNIDYDDMYISSTASKLGEKRVETLRPTADTAQKDFTASTGTSNYAMVDDTTADTTDYVQASTVGNLDLYDLTNLSATPVSIDAVQYTVFASKTDAASRAVAVVGDLSGTQQQTSNFSLGSGAVKYEDIKETKPGGGSWTASDVNALKIGPKVTV